MNWSGAIKLLSLFCVAIMLILTLNVVIDKVEAGSAGDERTAPAIPPSISEYGRLTLSSYGAHTPSIARASDDHLHVAWVDESPSGQTVMWKRSADGGASYTSDKVISPAFSSIPDVRITCSDSGSSVLVAIEADGGIYTIISNDQGDTWGDWYFLDDGHGPRVELIEGRTAILGFITQVEGVDSLVLARLGLVGDTISEATGLAAMAIGGPATFTVAGWSVCYALTVSTPESAVVYGRIGAGGKTQVEPTLVARLGKTTINDLELCVVEGEPLLAWSTSDTEASSIFLASPIGDESSWVVVEAERIQGRINGLSVSSIREGAFIAFENSSKAATTISAWEVGSNGERRSGSFCLSSIEGCASHPSVTTGSLGEVHCVFEQSFEGKSDIYRSSDVLLRLLDLERLQRFIDAMGDAAFVDAKQKEVDEFHVTLEALVGAKTEANEVKQKELLLALRSILDYKNPPLLGLFSSTALADLVLQQLSSLDNALQGKAAAASFSPDDQLSDQLMGTDSLDPPPPELDEVEGPYVENITAISALVYWRVTPLPPPYELGDIYLEWYLWPSGTHYQTLGGLCAPPAGHTGSQWFCASLANLSPGSRYFCQVLCLPNNPSTTFWTLPVLVENMAAMAESPTVADITWTSTVLATTKVYYGLTSSYGSVATGADGAYHQVRLTGLTPNTVYHYKVESKYVDDLTKFASSGDLTFKTNVSITGITILPSFASATVSWKTDMNSTSVLDYGIGSSYLYSGAVIENGKEHTAEVSGLNASLLYGCRIRSTYISDSRYYALNYTSFWSTDLQVTDLSTKIGADNVLFKWNTTDNATGEVLYGISPSSLNLRKVANDGMEHSVRIENLTKQAHYYYRVLSKFLYDNTINDSVNGDLTTHSYGVTSVKATLISQNANSTYNVLITWVSTFFGTAKVTYSLYSDLHSPSYAYGNQTREHAVRLSYLTANTRYYYKVESKPVNDPPAPAEVSSTYNFETRVYIYNLQATVNGNLTSCTITWTTNVPCTTVVRYGTSPTLSRMATGASSVTSHSVTLFGLTPFTWYYYQAESNYTYGGNVIPASSGLKHFITGQLTITNLQISEITLTSVKVSWTTNLDANGYIEFAKCSLKEAPNLWNSGDYSRLAVPGSLTHTLTLTGLTPNATYTYRVMSRANSNPILSKTTAFNEFETRPALLISDLKWTTTDTSATGTWTTNWYSNTRIYYSQDTSYSSTATGSDALSHSVTISGLKSNTLYHFKASSIKLDQSLSAQTGDNVLSTTALMVHSVANSSLTTSSFTITWKSNFLASGKLEYGTTKSLGTNYNEPGGTKTSHSVTITGLPSNTLYYYRAVSTSSSNSSDIATSPIYTVKTYAGENDAGMMADAGNNFGSAMSILSGSFSGNLTSSSDIYDFYRFYAFVGQTINVTLAVPAGYNFNLYLYNQANTLKASSTKSTGLSEAVSFVADSEGNWRFEARWISGSGKKQYSASLHIFEAANTFTLDVGVTGDNYVNGHMPGLMLCNGTGWGSILTDPTRRAGVAGSGFLLTVDNEMQSRDYQLTLRYWSSSDIVVSVFTGGGWVNATELPGTSDWSSWSFLVSSLYLYDYLANQPGMNVRFNLSAPLELDTIVAVATASDQGVNDSGSGNTNAKADLPSYRLETGWTVKDWLANGSASATVIVSLSRTDISYLLRFTYANSTDGIEVQQQSSSGYKSIGRLHKWGQEAVIVLNREWYYDVDTSASAPGTNVRIKLITPLKELSSISITPAAYCTDVGTSYDDYSSSHSPGINILTNGEWGTIKSGNGRTYRSSTANANFFLNAPLSGTPYSITITYKTVNQTTLRQFNGTIGGVEQWTSLGSLIADGLWHTSSLMTKPKYYRDYVAGGDLNVIFDLTGSVTVDWLNASADEDNDSYSNYVEAMRSYENDTTSRLGSFTKTFTCWESGIYSITVYDTLVAYRYFDKLSGEVFYEPEYANISLDGVLKKCLVNYADGIAYKVTMTQYLAKGQHSVSLLARGTGSSQVNSIVVENAHSLNPYSSDTDSDGLTEPQEFASGTDPVVADTDNDGLADGQERYSALYSTDGFKKIVEDTQGAQYTAQIVKVRGVIGPIDHIYAHVGIIHPRIGDLRVSIKSPSGQYAYVFYQPGNSTSNLFKTYDLLSYFSPTAFQSDGNWTLQVFDLVSGQQGRIEYFRIQADGRTDQLIADSDGDGVLDGEEVNFGVDGWVTNPRLADTDGDGLSDSQEINGLTCTLKRSDPTRVDTDDDGFNDNVDVAPTGDAIVQVTIDKLFRYSDESFSPVFFTIEADGWHYSTARTPTDTPNSWATVGLSYFVDIWDSNTTASIRVRAWDENWNGDTEIDICPGAAKQFEGSYSILDNRWNDEWGTWVIDTDGKGDGYDTDQDARLVIQVKTVVREKAHTIVVNATDYGLDAVKEGEEYRFSGDDQIYMFYLNCSSASANFVQGLNVIVLPRSLALESKINSTLYNLQGAGVDNPLRNASLRTPPASGDSSGHIVAVISKNLTGEEAETLLGMMTHNSSDARIGNSQIVPSTMALYLMHLPLDVVSGIPVLDVVNSPAGNQPRSFWNYLTDTLVGVVEFLWHGLVATAQFMCFLALAMTGIGLIIYILCDPSVQAAISQAIDKIVDAFMEFVDWILDFIFDTVNILFGPVLSAMTAATNPYCAKVLASSKTIESDIQATGVTSARSKNSLSDSLLGPLYKIIEGVVLVIAALFILIKIFTVGCSFIISAVIGIIVAILIAGAISLFQLAFDEEATTPIGYIASFLKSFLIGNCQDNSARNGVICIIESSCEIFSMFICAGRAVWEDVIPGISIGAMKGIVLSVLGIAISLYSATTNAIGAVAIGWMLSFVGLYDSAITFLRFEKNVHAKELVFTALAISGFSFGTTSYELLSALSEEYG